MTPLPPNYFSSHDVFNSFGIFGLLLNKSTSCQGSQILFKYITGSSKVIPFVMKNCVKYTTHSNPAFIECTTFPSGWFKKNSQNCFVCFISNFKLGIIEGMHYNVHFQFGSAVDGIVRIQECIHDFLFKEI